MYYYVGKSQVFPEARYGFLSTCLSPLFIGYVPLILRYGCFGADSGIPINSSHGISQSWIYSFGFCGLVELDYFYIGKWYSPIRNTSQRKIKGWDGRIQANTKQILMSWLKVFCTLGQQEFRWESHNVIHFSSLISSFDSVDELSISQMVIHRQETGFLCPSWDITTSCTSSNIL